MISMPRIPAIPKNIQQLLGLSEKDIKVYRKLLALGSAPLRQIAEEASLPRATTHDVLKRLMKLKLVSYLDAKSHRYFTAEDPKRLKSLATQKEVEAQEAQAILKNLVPDLQHVLAWSKHRPMVKYFEGEEGVKEILEDVLKEAALVRGKQYRVYSSSVIRGLIAASWPGFVRMRIRRKIQVKAISMGEGGVTAGLDERRWLSKKEASPTYIFIYGHKTAYVSVDERGRLFGVIIEDAGIAETQRRIFDVLWGFLG